MSYRDKILGGLVLLFFFGCSKNTSDVLRSVSMNAAPKNVQIAKGGGGFGPCEPSIDINPTNPDNVVAGSILNRVHVSNDGGKTWANEWMSSSYGVYGDPVVRFGPGGEVYYSHLSNPSGRPFQSEDFLDRIVVQKSTDKGLKWTDGTAPENDRKKDQDKQWLYINPNNGEVLMTWTEFDKYGSEDPNDKSRILFSKSKDTGESWSLPVDISDNDGDCIDDDNTTEGAVPVVDREGTVYVTWAFNDKIYLDKSKDGGKTWLDNDITVANQFEGWSIDIPGITRCNGMPILGIDQSGSAHDGNLYINWSDQKNGIDDTDIWISRSTDGGMTWSDRIRVNSDPPGKHQFFSWMDVDPITGYIYIVFYDRRNHMDESTDVYLAFSTDGGLTFENKLISEKPFKPIKSDLVFFGDYNDISAYDGHVRPIWTRQDEYKLSVWTALIEMN